MHKSDDPNLMPIRPVVSFSGSPTYNLSKWLNNQFKQITNCNFQYTLTNNHDLVQKIGDIDIPPQAILVSFDVTNLFTNVPTSEVLDIVRDRLIDSNIPDNQVNDFYTLFDICFQQNFFKFNDVTYRQKDGLAMGLPLAPLSADLFLDNLERNHILNNNRFRHFIKYYYRFVDDILCLWLGDREDLSEFLEYINNIHPKINFTLETEQDSKINFLDLTITRVDNKHSFSIYRKPTNTGLILDNLSFHPFSHKMAALNSYVYRALAIPMSVDSLASEIKGIKQIAHQYHFPETLVDKLIQRRRLKNTNIIINQQSQPTHSNISNSVHKYHSITFNGPSSYKISKILSKNNIYIAFKSKDTLGDHLLNNKDKNKADAGKGIYQLTCSCSAKYVGRTYRNFNTRFKEHYRDIRLDREGGSHFAAHVLQTGHSPNINTDFKILHRTDNFYLQQTLEDLEITRLHNTDPRNTLNQQLSLDNNSLLKIFFEK